MNRIREHNNKYQVLITPCHKYDTSYELLLGNWDDFNFRGFDVLQVNDLESALLISNKLPDLDWHKLLLTLQNSFYDIKNFLESHFNLIATVNSNFTKPEIIKRNFFDRIIVYGNNFNLLHHMSDIINFTIKCNNKNYFNLVLSYLLNNKEISDKLGIIKKRTDNNNDIFLICKSSVNITYMIRVT